VVGGTGVVPVDGGVVAVGVGEEVVDGDPPHAQPDSDTNTAMPRSRRMAGALVAAMQRRYAVPARMATFYDHRSEWRPLFSPAVHYIDEAADGWHFCLVK